MRPILRKLTCLVSGLLAWLNVTAFTVNGLNYSVSGGVATLTGATSRSITSVTIPATVTYGGTTYPVNYIMHNAFDNYSSLRSVRFEDCASPIYCVIKNEGGYKTFSSPFENAPVEEYYWGRNPGDLTASTISENGVFMASTSDNVSITYAGYTTVINAKELIFKYMSASKVTSITLGGDIKTFSSYSFTDCNNLRKITLNPGSYTLPKSLFPSVEIDTLTINATHLSQCPALSVKHVSFGEGWESIPSSFFVNGTVISVELPSTLKEIGSSAFNGCSSLSKINYPESLSSIRSSAFLGCSKLPSPVFGNQLETIEGGAFNNCTSITDITIPGSVTYIGHNAFVGCSNLRNVKFDKSEKEITLDGSDYDRPFNNLELDSLILNRVLPLIGNVRPKYVSFGEGWESIPSSFFVNGTVISVELPSTLKEIGSSAFNGCSSLSKINYPESLSSIRSSAFLGCSELPSPVFGNQLETIETCAFSNCTSITDITIPGSVTYLGNAAFVGCSNLRNVKFDKSEKEITLDGYDYDRTFNNLELDSLILNRVLPLIGNVRPKYVSFGEGWESIPSSFFVMGTVISVELPSTLKEIGSSAFNGCSSLSKINYPESLSSIRSSAFYGCSKLPSPVFGNQLETIEGSAFSNCTSITDITIPGSVTYIGHNAFGGCSNLRNVKFDKSEKGITLDGYDYDRPFNNLELDSLILNRVLPLIGNVRPKYVSFGEGWESISSSLFSRSNSIVSLSLPSTLKSIGSNAFGDCTKLDSIFTQAKEPPTCGSSNVFSSEIYPKARLKVPMGSRRKYAGANVWKNFANIITEGSLLVTVDYDRSKGEVTINGEKTDSLELDEGEALDIIVKPLTGFSIESMTANGEDCTDRLVNGALHYDEISDTVAFAVKFAPIMLDIKLPSDIKGGRVEINGLKDAPASLQYGSRVELRPVADTGYQLKTFGVNDKTVALNANGVYVIESLTEAINVEAVFEIIRFKAAAKYDSGRGVVLFNGKTGDADVDYGTSLTITATPNEGNYVDRMTVNGSAVSREQLGKPVTISRVTEDVAVEVAFEIYTYVVAAKYDTALGSVTVNGSEGSADIAWGADAVVAITPAYGYQIASVALDGKDVTESVDVTSGTFVISSVKAQHSIVVAFEPKRVRLSIVLEGGVLSSIHDFGTELRYFPEADKNWIFHSATVGENVITELDGDGSFLTGALTDDTSISIVFRSNEDSMDSVAAGNPVGVAVRDHTVVITGASDDSVAEVYDVAGLCYYRGRDRVISIEKDGVYVVAIGGQSFKVILR